MQITKRLRDAWNALRGKTKKYRDKDGNPNLLAWLKAIGLDTLMSGAGMVPTLGKTAVEFAESTVDKILKKNDIALPR
jgi:hypothetical protein